MRDFQLCTIGRDLNVVNRETLKNKRGWFQIDLAYTTGVQRVCIFLLFKRSSEWPADRVSLSRAGTRT